MAFNRIIDPSFRLFIWLNVFTVDSYLLSQVSTMVICTFFRTFSFDTVVIHFLPGNLKTLKKRLFFPVNHWIKLYDISLMLCLCLFRLFQVYFCLFCYCPSYASLVAVLMFPSSIRYFYYFAHATNTMNFFIVFAKHY